MDTTTDLTKTERDLLAKIDARIRKIEARPKILRNASHRYQLKHGAAYSHKSWWGPVSNGRVRTIQRAIDKLRHARLIETHVRGARRISHIRLTDAGREAVSHPAEKSQ